MMVTGLPPKLLRLTIRMPCWSGKSPERVRTAIGLLPGHHREVIVLREIEGFSYLQIANILDCPTGTVMSRLGRARPPENDPWRDEVQDSFIVSMLGNA
jgi:hypothetical protein